MKKIILYTLTTLIVLTVLIIGGRYIDQRASSDKLSFQTPSGPVLFSNYGPAPEFAGISHWLNSQPLTLQSLRGKVVLVDFWTYSCINCLRTLPYVTKWYNTYKDQGLVVIGVHTPEFAFEKDTANVADAAKRLNITYPVAQDNNYATWDAYHNEYWPAEYLIDQKGDIVYTHFGEGEYDHTENAIRELLGLSGNEPSSNGPDLSQIGSPEMYFGTNREENLTGGQTPSSVPQNYTAPTSLNLNEFALSGQWQFYPDKAVLVNGPGQIKLHFHSAKVHIVADSQTQPIAIKVTVDGQAQAPVTVGPSQLYTLFNSTDYADHSLEIDIPQAGLEAFTFTFG